MRTRAPSPAARTLYGSHLRVMLLAAFAVLESRGSSTQQQQQQQPSSLVAAAGPRPVVAAEGQSVVHISKAATNVTVAGNIYLKTDDDPEGRTCPGSGSVPAKYAENPVCSKMPCTESIPADLSLPPVLFGSAAAAAAGKRVAQTTPGLGYNTSRVFHSLYLPPDWVDNSSAKYPIIVEYSGNTILPSDQNMTAHGWGIGQGKVFIWVVLPFISGRSPTLSAAANAAAACSQRWYHGCAPECCDISPFSEMHQLCQAPHPNYDPQPTIDCKSWGAGPAPCAVRACAVALGLVRMLGSLSGARALFCFCCACGRRYRNRELSRAAFQR